MMDEIQGLSLDATSCLDMPADAVDLFSVMSFAIDSHADQKRKYTGEPYWKHLSEVAGIVSGSGSFSSRAVALAWLHDVVEDTSVSFHDIEVRFGLSIAKGVMMLTSCSDASLNRSQRKGIDRLKIAGADVDVQTVKMADIISNLSSISIHDPGFAINCYIPEKMAMLDVLDKPSDKLRAVAMKTLIDSERIAKSKLNIV